MHLVIVYVLLMQMVLLMKMARVVLAVTATIAEQEAATLKARTLSGKRHKVLKEGYSYTQIAPYGYDYDKETKLLSVNEKRQK